MHLSVLRLNPASAAVQNDLRDVANLHRTIMKAFPTIIDPEVKARAYYDVLHRLELERNTGRILLYVQSRVAPDWSKLPSGYVHPENEVRTKSVGEVYAGLKAGRLLRFRLRANPTRKIDTKSDPDGKRRNGRRVTVGGPAEQVEWLARKAEACGFQIIQASLASTGSGERVYSSRMNHSLQGAVFEGCLVVRDPGRFRESLVKGIGPAKAFGYGLLSIGPA